MLMGSDPIKLIKTPFIVINADDYYGKEGFKAVHEYLVNGGKSCMAGFVLKNTLSDNGGATRVTTVGSGTRNGKKNFCKNSIKPIQDEACVVTLFGILRTAFV